MGTLQILTPCRNTKLKKIRSLRNVYTMALGTQEGSILRLVPEERFPAAAPVVVVVLGVCVCV